MLQCIKGMPASRGRMGLVVISVRRGEEKGASASEGRHFMSVRDTKRRKRPRGRGRREANHLGNLMEYPVVGETPFR